MKISLRDFANWTERAVLSWIAPRRAITLTDDEGKELVSDTYILGADWYNLSIHRDYDKYPYLIKHLIHDDIISDDSLDKPVNEFLQELMPDVDCPLETDQIKQRIYERQIKLNNYFVIMGEGGEISATAQDVANIIASPPIASIKERLDNREITIEEADAEFKEAILHSPDVPINSFSLLTRTGGVSVNQGFQLCIVRGSVFDLNNQILPNNVDASFAQGITNLADALGENRGAGKSLLSNGAALENSQWFHRKLKITNAVIMGIDHLSDCGTDQYVPVKMAHEDQSKSFIGKYILHNDELRLMTRALAKEYPLGTVVKTRSTSFCENHKSGTPCGVCYGKIKASIPYNVIMLKSANPGMFSATEIAERIGQALLSTKHFLKHTVAIPFVVARIDQDIINTDGDYIYLNKELVKAKTELSLEAIHASELADLKGLDSLEDISEDQLRTFDTANLRYVTPDPMTDGESLYDRAVKVSVSSRSSRMSMALIEYALEHGWERSKKKMTIDLSKWDYSKPLFFLPYVHEDLSQYQRQVESFLLFKGRNDAWLSRVVTPEIFGEVLSELWLLINRKFQNINVVHPEILLTSLLTRDPENGFYGLPVGREPRYFSGFTRCIENRGMGALFIYQDQNRVIEKPRTYGIKGRQPSLMEAYMSNAV